MLGFSCIGCSLYASIVKNYQTTNKEEGTWFFVVSGFARFFVENGFDVFDYRIVFTDISPVTTHWRLRHEKALGIERAVPGRIYLGFNPGVLTSILRPAIWPLPPLSSPPILNQEQAGPLRKKRKYLSVRLSKTTNASLK